MRIEHLQGVAIYFFTLDRSILFYVSIKRITIFAPFYCII